MLILLSQLQYPQYTMEFISTLITVKDIQREIILDLLVEKKKVVNGFVQILEILFGTQPIRS